MASFPLLGFPIAADTMAALYNNAVKTKNAHPSEWVSQCHAHTLLRAAVPEGADAYLMKYIIHLFSDADALRILRDYRHAVQHDGKLLLIERVLKGSNEPDPGKFMDLQMLVVSRGGRERSEADYRALLYEAGFSLTQVIPTAGPLSFVESQPL